MSNKKKWGVVLIIAPIVFFIITFILQILTRFLLSDAEALGPIRLIVNILSLILGVLSIVGFLPCLIIGIIMLASPDKPNNDQFLEAS